MFEYLEKFKAENIPETTLKMPFNCFGDVQESEIITGEKILGFPFPEKLKIFWRTIGTGKLAKPHNAPDDYDNFVVNEILPPIAVANFYKGTFFWEGQ